MSFSYVGMISLDQTNSPSSLLLCLFQSPDQTLLSLNFSPFSLTVSEPKISLILWKYPSPHWLLEKLMVMSSLVKGTSVRYQNLHGVNEFRI